MRRLWLLGRIIAIGIVVASLGFGIQCWMDSARSSAKIDQARAAEPLRMNVDLSKSGVYTGHFDYAFRKGHGAMIVFRTTPPFLTDEALGDALEGLVLHVRVRDPNGATVEDASLSQEDILSSLIWGTGQDRGLYWLHVASGDTYTIEIDVRQPAMGLAGREQIVVGRYMICGCAYMGPQIGYAMAIVCWLMSAIVLAVLLTRWLRRRGTDSK